MESTKIAARAQNCVFKAQQPVRWRKRQTALLWNVLSPSWRLCVAILNTYILTKEISQKPPRYHSYCVWLCTRGTSGGKRQHENMGGFFNSCYTVAIFYNICWFFSLNFCTAFAFTLWANLYLTPVLQSLYSTILWQTIIDLTVMLCALKINDKNPSKRVRLILITFRVSFFSQLSDLSNYFITIHVRHCVLISYEADLVLLQIICK